MCMNISNSKWFKHLLGPQLRLLLAGLLFCLIVSVSLGAAVPIIIKSFYGAFDNNKDFYQFGSFLLGIFIFEYINRVFFQIQVNKLVKEMIFYVRGSTYSTWLRSYEMKNNSDDDPYPLGEVMARIMNDSDAIRELITSGAFGIFIDLCFIVSCLISFLFLNLRSGLVLMVIEVSACLGLIWGSKYMAKVFLAVRAASGQMSRKIANVVGGIRENYYNQHNNYASKVTLKTFKHFLKQQLNANVWDASYYSLAESLFPMLLMIIVLILPYSKITEVAVIVAIIDLIQRSINPIKNVAGKISNIQRAATGIDRIDNFISDLERGGLSANKNVFESDNINSFHLKINEFQYADKRNKEREKTFKLEEIDIFSTRGDYIGILGHSGSGKSTVLGLASLNIFSENLFLELDMKEKKLTWSPSEMDKLNILKSHIGLISQDSHVFSESLAFNITMQADYKRSEFDEFWEQMTERFEYLRTWGIEGDDKINVETISLGQKQIISALRVCFQNKPIILFDEISSSLDAGCEEALRGLIKYKQKDSIVWVVTHRVESVLDASKILLMNEGKVVDQGTHQQLLNSSNLYGRFLAELR